MFAGACAATAFHHHPFQPNPVPVVKAAADVPASYYPGYGSM